MTPQTCEQCGHSFSPAAAPGGMCPRCLLFGGAEEQADEALSLEDLQDAIPGFRVEAHLGRGGMGTVYRARQLDLDRDVAIKFISAKNHDPSFGERFEREARTMARLNHPNIVTVHRYGHTADGDAFIVMEYVAGGDLAQLIAAGKIPEATALPLVEQVCSALAYAHDQGCVHRDIKPGNILINAQGSVKVADFGLAKLLDENPASASTHTSSSAGVGTPLYAAPEQTKLGAVVDCRADIYALGVVLYEMLTGELPRGVFQNPSKMSGTLRRWDDLILRAMDAKPERRFSTALDLGRELAFINRALVFRAGVRRIRWKKLGIIAACIAAAVFVVVPRLLPTDFLGGRSRRTERVAAFTAPAGKLDNTFSTVLGGGGMLCIAVQPDGKTIIGGRFTTAGGAEHTNLARLNTDGSVDSTFTASTNSQVDCVAMQADGKIVLGGEFTTVNGQPRNAFARLNQDGSLESTATFNAGTGANDLVTCVAVQADGKILLGGKFATVNGVAMNRIARLNPDGTLEGLATFNPGTGANDTTVFSVAVQADGKILLGGNFTSVNGQTRNRIARLNGDGTLESTATFDPGTGANAHVLCLAVQGDGKIVLGGLFTSFNGVASNRIARLDGDGSLESTATFNPGTGANAEVSTMTVQADGKILLGGFFTAVNDITSNRIARLNGDGSLESTATFNPGTGANDAVYCVAVQADGKIVLGGGFTTVNGTARNGIARLNNDATTQSLTASDPTQVLWSRGGAGPEVSQMTFERSADGGSTWIMLGSGTRVGTSANWQLTGLSLPASGHLRARGRTAGGYLSGSSGLIEQGAAFTASAPTTVPGAPTKH